MEECFKGLPCACSKISTVALCTIKTASLINSIMDGPSIVKNFGTPLALASVVTLVFCAGMLKRDMP